MPIENEMLNTTSTRFGLNEIDKVRTYLGTAFKEDGILKPLMESEKEIDV